MKSEFLVDAFGRPLRDLRISVTDRCNLRCTYCMPRDAIGTKFSFLPHGQLLSFEEIHRLARLFVALGVRKIRLTGGEPLMRHGLEGLIEKLARLRDARGDAVEVALITNGTQLAKRARQLKDAGLSRLTVSLDALSEPTFRRITDAAASVGTVLDGIAAAQAVGLAPVKVNTVVQRGVNEHEILPLVRYFRNTGVIVRFIEFMDVGNRNQWRLDDVVSARDILARIDQEIPIQPLSARHHGEVAKRWAFADGSGEIGVIASVTQAFCHECTRLRLSTDGKLFTCLFASTGNDLRTALRRGADDDEMVGLIRQTWQQRSDRYSQLRHDATRSPARRIEMSYIGG
ncbi:GTP 3',8-cyclase MoaA [Propionivibrio dicarboxylicus]|uniref:GTP 3',8-cyclase n=1 Tax=Propionivibrio dicarboxylicus TaxID=83767 RepID=A0A1G8K0S5_9RHOO|nr:GTP 3',8-cyclase MoaA [Propionivibrio dicarboxylicus]SDI37052.1 cyclic pyranopterin monophosphate synthase subunit MoaA [Propionivibrio dicarboxylicus]